MARDLDPVIKRWDVGGLAAGPICSYAGLGTDQQHFEQSEISQLLNRGFGTQIRGTR